MSVARACDAHDAMLSFQPSAFDSCSRFPINTEELLPDPESKKSYKVTRSKSIKGETFSPSYWTNIVSFELAITIEVGVRRGRKKNAMSENGKLCPLK